MTSPPRVDELPWEQFYDDYFQWGAGEHVGLIGPSGTGKTTLALHLLPLMHYVVVFGTKPRDKVADQLKKNNSIGGGQYKHIETWDTKHADLSPRRLLWPDSTDLYSDEKQRVVFQQALRNIYREGGWTLFLDDLQYLVQQLNLKREVTNYLIMARANDIQLVTAFQRPRFVPLAIYDQSTHLFFSKDNDRRNLTTISDVGYTDSDLIRQEVSTLKKHEFLYLNTRDGDMFRLSPPPVS